MKISTTEVSVVANVARYTSGRVSRKHAHKYPFGRGPPAAVVVKNSGRKLGIDKTVQIKLSARQPKDS